MKKAGSKLDFCHDTVTMFGENVKLSFTQSGHYCIPISNKKQLICQNGKDQVKIVLHVSDLSSKDTEEKKKMVLKLHQQFSHPSKERLRSLVTSAGIKDQQFLKLIETVSNECEVCQLYRKPSPKPIVGFPNARVFNQTVAMDLKEYSKNVWFLHLIDLATRYSAAAVIRSKDKDVIAKKLCQIWIAIFGSPHKFLSDNGGEFSNEVYRDLCENFNIFPATTAAESPWSNGTCERHNAVLSEAVTKTMVDTKCDLETALAWALSAKNSLQSFYGFSPNQLVFGRNPNLPSVLVDDPPALEGTSCSQMIADNLNALHRAREAFIQQEASEKIRQALRHQIRPSGDLKFVCGDIVYYKRNDSSKWKGPGTVIGQEGQQILVKHGGVYVRVHPCRLLHKVTPEVCQVSEGESRSVQKSETEHVVQKCKSIDEPEKQVVSDDGYDMSDKSQNSQIGTMESNAVHVEETESITQSQEVDNNMQTSLNSKLVLPRVNQKVKYLPSGGDSWKEAIILSRAGKATGKYRNFLNIKVTDEEQPKCIDWQHDVTDWEELWNKMQRS